ncbi:hypothetical protein ALC53_01266 [Atta colombica]|uniref:Uncharacterized protein n=1 Tax=Atta colombica TaxID=520822 RepID=A0A195BW58_9HYME|nr:hypothetical protein ALC53_01266 [Atta colombica]
MLPKHRRELYFFESTSMEESKGAFVRRNYGNYRNRNEKVLDPSKSGICDKTEVASGRFRRQVGAEVETAAAGALCG